MNPTGVKKASISPGAWRELRSGITATSFITRGPGQPQAGGAEVGPGTGVSAAFRMSAPARCAPEHKYWLASRLRSQPLCLAGRHPGHRALLRVTRHGGPRAGAASLCAQAAGAHACVCVYVRACVRRCCRGVKASPALVSSGFVCILGSRKTLLLFK